MEPEATGAAGTADAPISAAAEEAFFADAIMNAVMGSFMMKNIQEAAKEFKEEQ